jgi:hypothetical protein
VTGIASSTDGGEAVNPKQIRRIAAGIGLFVAVVCLFLLMLEGTPEDPSIAASVVTKRVHATRSGCSKTCEKPQTTEGEVSVAGKTTDSPGSGGALDRALDNDVGVTVIRLLLALLTGVATAVATARLLTDIFPEDRPDVDEAPGPPEPNPEPSPPHTKRRREERPVARFGDDLDELDENPGAAASAG